MSKQDGVVDLDELENLFGRALDLDPQGRLVLIARVRVGNPDLAQALTELLQAAENPDARLEGDADGGDWVLAALDTPAMETEVVDQTVGLFRLIEKLGEGGMATVYRAVRETQDFHQQVAIKILKGGRVTEEGLARFARERRIVASLDHPNIARLIDGGLTSDQRPFVALELVEGRAIDRYCDEESLSIEDRLRLIIDVGKALHYAHQNLVVHRDLKPSNVMVDATGRVRLLDFGIAKELIDDHVASALTRAEALPMTPLYASPEQLSGDPVTTASDQYQIGLLLFELITGQCHHLLDGDDARSILERASRLDTPRPSAVLKSRSTITGRREQQSTDQVASLRRTTLKDLVLDVRGDLDWIVLKALDRNPDKRYPSVAALVADIEKLLEGRPIAARPPSLTYTVRKWVGRHRVRSTLAAALILALLGSWIFVQAQRTRAQKLRMFALKVERQTEQIERLLREASLRPLHDMTPERAAVEALIGQLQTEARSSPKLLGPAAAYGVGRGLLALGETEQAATSLEEAWNAGFRGDGIRYSLGSALGELYRERLRAAQGLDDETLRSQRIREAQVDFRDRALEHLGAVESEDLAELRTALIAFYEGDYDAALERVDRVRDFFPWQHEALAIEAAVLTQRAQMLNLLGNAEGARADVDRARIVLGEALEIGRSDAQLYLRNCELGSMAIRLGDHPLQELPSMVEATRTSCERAATIRPDWALPWVSLAELYLTWWDVDSRRGTDSELVIEPMREAAERAVELDPTNAEAQHRLGLALYTAGRSASRQGRDPMDLLGQAAAALKTAVELDPGYPFTYNGLALVANEKAYWLLQRGRNPMTWVNQGRSYAERAVELAPTWHNARSNLANSHVLAGSWAAVAGGDPTPALRNAIAEVDRALATNPDYVRIRRMRTLALQNLVAFGLERGQNSSIALAELRSEVRILLAARPMDIIVLITAIRTELMGVWRQPVGKDPSAALERARQHGELAKQVDPSSLTLSTLLIELELVDARFARGRGISPEPALRRAESIIESIADRERWDAILDKAIASTYRHLAAGRLLQGAAPTVEITAGLTAARRGREWNPRHWGSRAEEAALTLLAAIERDNDKELLAQAREQLQEILRLNPPLLPAVEPLSTIADGLESGSLPASDAAEQLFAYRSSFPIR